MPTFEVVFKAGFETDAKDKDTAISEAKVELLKEIAASGINKFVVDATQLEG